MHVKINLRKSYKILHNNTTFITEPVSIKLEVHKFPVLFNAVAKNWDFYLTLLWPFLPCIKYTRKLCTLKPNQLPVVAIARTVKLCSCQFLIYGLQHMIVHGLIILEHAQCKCKDEVSFHMKATVHWRRSKQFIGHSSHATVFNCWFDVRHVLFKIACCLTMTYCILESSERRTTASLAISY